MSKHRFIGNVTLLAVLALSVSVAPASAAALVYAPTADDHLGLLDGRLDESAATYGESSAFDGAQTHLSRAAFLLVENATVSAISELTTAAAALETGRAQAIAEGHEDRDQAVKNEAVRLADQAQRTLHEVRDRLGEVVDDGMTAQTLDYAVLTAYNVLLAEERLRTHGVALGAWEAGERGESLERGLVGNAGAAVLLADVATDIWNNGSQVARDDGLVLERAALSELAHARAAHARGNALEIAQTSRERVDTLVREERPVLALAAFYLWTQDVTFTEQQASHGNTTADRLLSEEGPKVRDWVGALNVTGELPLAALESAQVANSEEASPTDRAYAAALVVLAVEHTALLVDGYSGTERVLGTTLPNVPEMGWPSWVLWAGGLVIASILAAAALLVRARGTT